MPTSLPNPACPLLPDDLRVVLSSRAPGNNLATALADALTVADTHLAELAATWLTDREHRHYDRFSFVKRRTEWLSGRICAKRAILDLLSGQPGADPLRPLDISIEIGSTGRPVVDIGARARPIGDLDISISHSHGKAIGIAGHGLCGVDIQHLNDTLFRVKSRYCSQLEAAVLEPIPEGELVQLGLLWVGKEAIRKCFSNMVLLGFLEIRLERISVDRGYRLLNFQLCEPPLNALGTISVTTHVHEAYALAVCTLGAERLQYAGIA